MLIFLASLTGCIVFILSLRRAAHYFDLVDHPGGRKQHTHPTPTVGGLAMYLAVLLALLWHGGVSGEIAVLMKCSAALVLLGIFDDKHGLSVRTRLIIQVVLAAVAASSTGEMITHLGALAGSDIRLGIFAIPISVVAYVGGINAMNMIDGADGMAGKMASISMLGIAVIAYFGGDAELLPLTLAMLGALAGFLLFNSRLFVRRAWVFMGDAGSMWLGLMLAWLLARITSNAVAAEPALALWLFGIPLIDTLTVMARRLRQNGSPFAADRSHIHHLLEHAGLSVRRTVLVLSLTQLILVGIGVCFYLTHAPAWLVFWSFVLFMVIYCYLPRHCKMLCNQ